MSAISVCACGRRKKRTSARCIECRRRDPSLRPVMERFWEKVDTTASGGCWVWTGNIESNGYGRFYFRGRLRWAHRAAYELLVGPIPEGHEIRHLVCDNPPCVNPAHLATGTRMQNVGDAVRKLRHAFGERGGTAKLTEEQVRDIKSQVARGGRLHKHIAADYGVSRSTVDMIGRGERWARVR